MGRLTPKVLAAALTDPPFSRKSLTASTFSGDNAGGLPRGPTFGRGAVHASLDPVPDGLPLPLRQGEQHMEHEPGGWTVVPGVQPLRQGADVDPLVMKLLDRFEPLPRGSGPGGRAAGPPPCPPAGATPGAPAKTAGACSDPRPRQ